MSPSDPEYQYVVISTTAASEVELQSILRRGYSIAKIRSNLEIALAQDGPNWLVFLKRGQIRDLLFVLVNTPGITVKSEVLTLAAER